MDGTRQDTAQAPGSAPAPTSARCTACGSDGSDVAPGTTCCVGEGTRPARRPRVSGEALLAMLVAVGAGPPLDAHGRLLLS